MRDRKLCLPLCRFASRVSNSAARKSVLGLLSAVESATFLWSISCREDGKFRDEDLQFRSSRGLHGRLRCRFVSGREEFKILWPMDTKFHVRRRDTSFTGFFRHHDHYYTRAVWGWRVTGHGVSRFLSTKLGVRWVKSAVDDGCNCLANWLTNPLNLRTEFWLHNVRRLCLIT